jgi:UDP-GlcNAc:undecaprenyl-phosphate GlcNAc-1-phosphate transferase
VATVLLVMGLPILDVAWLIVSRWRRGGSREMGVGGRDHLHYRLLDMGFTPRQVVLGYSAFCLAFGAAALGLENRTYKVVALLMLTVLALSVLIWAEQRDAPGN